MMRSLQRVLYSVNIARPYYCVSNLSFNTLGPSIVSSYKIENNCNLYTDMVAWNTSQTNRFNQMIFPLYGVISNLINYDIWFTRHKLKAKKKAKAKKKDKKIPRGKL
eukprot:14493_1